MGGLPRWAILGRGNRGLGGFNGGTPKVGDIGEGE